MSNVQGALMIDLEGLELSSEEKELLKHPWVGGVILFQRNCVSPDQLAELTRSIRSHAPHLMIGVDQEGGRVVRFKAGFSPLHSMKYFGDLYADNSLEAFKQLRRQVLLMSAELQAVGVHFTFAPVLDLNWGCSAVIGDRSFHANPEVVVSLSEVFIDALHQVKMPAIGKHFPGHGAIKEDSHLELSEDHRSYSQIRDNDLRPFQALSAQLDGMMSAHVVYPEVDKLPASLSAHWLNQILRGEIGYQGLIFSDDLSMRGIEHVGSIEDSAQMALDAGSDMLLLCNNRDKVISLIDSLPPSFIEPQRLQRFTKWTN